MITATFCILLKVNSLSIFFDRMISSLNFTPNKMDVYYNEFFTPKFLVKYNPQLPHLLSKAEVDGGITSFSLYDSKYSNERVTPILSGKNLRHYIFKRTSSMRIGMGIVPNTIF